MITIREEREGGRWEGVALTRELATQALAFADAARCHGTPTGRDLPLAGTPVWFKGEAFAGNSAQRHLWRKRLGGRPYPRLAEYENLNWLRAHEFDAPEPLVAAVWMVNGLPRWQFLATRLVTGVVTLDTFLARAHTERTALLDQLALSVARMHALGFVHRDLFPRNLLVRAEDSPQRIVFIDAWRGGARRQSRGPSYDLACLFLQLPEWLDRGEQRRWFERYLEGCASAGTAPHPDRLVRSMERARRGWIRRLERQPARLGGAPPPDPAWRVPRERSSDSLHR